MQVSTNYRILAKDASTIYMVNIIINCIAHKELHCLFMWVYMHTGTHPIFFVWVAFVVAVVVGSESCSGRKDQITCMYT